MSVERPGAIIRAFDDVWPRLLWEHWDIFIKRMDCMWMELSRFRKSVQLSLADHNATSAVFFYAVRYG